MLQVGPSIWRWRLLAGAAFVLASLCLLAAPASAQPSCSSLNPPLTGTACAQFQGQYGVLSTFASPAYSARNNSIMNNDISIVEDSRKSNSHIGTVPGEQTTKTTAFRSSSWPGADRAESTTQLPASRTAQTARTRASTLTCPCRAAAAYPRSAARVDLLPDRDAVCLQETHAKIRNALSRAAKANLVFWPLLPSSPR